MFMAETHHPSRPLQRARRIRRSIIIAVAVGVTVLGAPFQASAEPHPHHAGVARQSASPDEVGSSARVDAGALLDACPIDGSATFEDSWGWARSGGRSHEGVDLIAERGTPVIAVRDGFAEFKTNGLGGRAIWLTAANDDKFYYAHLSAWEGESREVLAGDLIGYVGSSGNARGPHLHFETLPGGDVENPYPHTFRACVPPPEPVINEIAQKNSSASITAPKFPRFRSRF